MTPLPPPVDLVSSERQEKLDVQENIELLLLLDDVGLAG